MTEIADEVFAAFLVQMTNSESIGPELAQQLHGRIILSRPCTADQLVDLIRLSFLEQS